MRFETATGTPLQQQYFTILLYRTGQLYLFGFVQDYQFNTPNLVDDQWHSIALTYNGAGSVSLYIDHALFQTVDGFNFNTFGDNNYLGIGSSDSHPFAYNYIGDLRNIAFYDYALTASSLSSTAPSGMPTSSPSPTALSGMPTSSPSPTAPSVVLTSTPSEAGSRRPSRTRRLPTSSPSTTALSGMPTSSPSTTAPSVVLTSTPSEAGSPSPTRRPSRTQRLSRTQRPSA